MTQLDRKPSHVERVLASRAAAPSRRQVMLPMFDDASPAPALHVVEPPDPLELPPTVTPGPASGEKAKARDILAAIRLLKRIEEEHRPSTTDERDILSRFGGFGAVALSIFPDPVTGRFKDGWQAIGEELRELLTPEEYDSAKRTTFSQFFTSPVVMDAMHEALSRLGVPDDATVLEPGCGCIQGDAMIGISRAGNSKQIRLSDLALKQHEAFGRYVWDKSIPTYVQREQDGFVRLALLRDVWCSGLKETFSIRTASGRTVRATAEHPFLTERGWLKLSEIVPGDLVHVHGPRSSAGATTKPRYVRVFGMEYHPYANRFRNGSAMVPQHRLVAEARLNEISYKDLLQRLGHYASKGPRQRRENGTWAPVNRLCDIDGLSFLDPDIWVVHHRDHDTKNNKPDNLEVLTHAEHMAQHVEDYTPACFSSIALEPVEVVEHFGMEMTYDISVEDDPHNFITNGFVVHNSGQFMTGPHRYIGVELDSLSGRIARALHPEADIRIENFRDSKLPPLDAVIGNVPFADVKIDFQGNRLSLHDYFIAKSVDSLKPGGVLAVVTSHYTLDKQNAAAREHLASKADFLGAIRLPSDAFKREGTAVTTDILFLRKRAPGQEPDHADPEWLETSVLGIAGGDLPVNRYFCNHHEMVLGDWSRKDTLYGTGFSVASVGDLASQLKEAVARLPGQVVRSEAERANPPPVPQVEGRFHQVQAPDRQVPPAFTPPPPLRHIAEGSFFVGDDRVIRQMENGSGEPVTYGGTLLRSDGTPSARRFAALIELRDDARRVLQSQNEGWPQEHREAARRQLNHRYDLFVSRHGPINKTTFSETKDGTQIRRMPNLVKFREDPDAMLVMSLEEYDEATGTAEKAAIMRKDVVGPKPPIDRVTSAEEGLLVSLDHKGGIDLPFIAGLYGKSEPEIIDELGDLIYRDPASKEWQTADAYLSGNVRAKLAAAEQAGPEYARNAEALRQVQPEDVLPGDIDANLGAPWIPASDIRAFAAELFNVPPEAFQVGHLKKDAVWSLEPDYRAINSVAATADYGTGRINGTELLNLALNMKTPVIYDIVRGANGDERVLNPTETAAAREKQKAIKERFKGWIFADPDRTERLVRDYNDIYNNLRPRLFDGSHLDFPGMSKAIELRPHQKDGVWRCMTAGNTLLAHVVGAGKTGCAVAAGMKMEQAGIIKKPLYVVPNHCLDQFGREFMQWYPNAKVLIASKEDFTRERRKALTAKIATGDWDGIVVTQSSFERIGMSREYQERFLREQIAEYEALLVDKASHGRNIIKTLEKQKARREEKLKDLLAEDKKDDGLVFDELGVDQIFYDEAHHAKNLETATKMDRVAGIQTGGSERAFDLYMKARYLGERHPGHGVAFLTGTPISNTMVEMFTMQRFLDPEGLRSRGIEHFDAWAASFGEVVDAMEISPDGASLRPRSRFAKFVNLPELVQMFRAFADVQTADMLDLPRPALEGGKPQTVACPMSEEQAELQAKLIERYDRIRSSKVDPREDNALAITTDGRKLALDGRMLQSGGDFPGSKINALAANVVRIWEQTAPTRGTQMVFCDMGVNPTPWGFSAYDEVAAKLEERGIPRNQIAIMGDADTDAKKQALFEKVRQGTVRVLIGSTAKMGTGTNVQKRLVALHHLDAPWKPAEVEQREGRILRQGNQNKEVSIFRYVTEGSFDAYMWQALETKARFIAQVMSGDCAVRKAEDIGGQELSYAEVKAIASGNPAVLTLAETDAELQRLAILRKNHHDEQYLARRNLRDLPDDIKRLEERLESLTADMATLKANGAIPSQETVAERMNRMPEKVSETYRTKLGSYRGLECGIILHPLGGTEVYLDGATRCREALIRDNPGPRAVLNALARLAEGYEDDCRYRESEIAVKRGQLQDYESRLGKPFQHAEYQSQLADLRDQLKIGLSEHPPEGSKPVGELAEQIRTLTASVKVEEAPDRGARKATRAERPVTQRIRERWPVATEVKADLIEPESEDQPARALALHRPATPLVHHRQEVSRRRGGGSQMTLF